MPAGDSSGARWGGNNGSAFFFNLPLRAKSAMAEILVSDLCARRLSAAGDLLVGLSLLAPGCASTRPDARLFPFLGALWSAPQN